MDNLIASHVQSGDDADRAMMRRAIALSIKSGEAGEYPYGVLICRGEEVVAESTNRVKHDGDVTRHAEIVAISAAQKALGRTSLDDCDIYINAEPCALCSYAIRESRIRRVLYGLHSPHMGGRSKWNVLLDQDLSRSIPEVFAPPPVVIGGFMAREAQDALFKLDPLISAVMKERGLFVAMQGRASWQPRLPFIRLPEWLMGFLRRVFFDRFGRR
jgi:tRNA(adenine34) deaminase